MHIGTRSAPVHPGQIVLIPRGRSQYIRNTGAGDLVFLCIVTPKWQAADEELVDRKPDKTVSARMRAAVEERQNADRRKQEEQREIHLPDEK